MRCHHTKFCNMGDQAPGILASFVLDLYRIMTHAIAFSGNLSLSFRCEDARWGPGSDRLQNLLWWQPEIHTYQCASHIVCFRVERWAKELGGKLWDLGQAFGLNDLESKPGHCVSYKSKSLEVDWVWNVMVHAQKPDFVFRRNGRVHLNRRRASVQSTTGSRGVLISGSNAGYTMFRGSVKGTGCPLHSPVSPTLPRPCVTVCHHISTGLYYMFVYCCMWLWCSCLKAYSGW